MSAKIDFEKLHQYQIEQVRATNQSELHGRPLQWPTVWGTKIPAILRGWSSGLVLIAGQSNHGKSSVAISMGLALASHNKDLWVLDFSLDDDLRDRISKYVAIMSGLSPEAVKMEHHYMNNIQDPDAREEYQRALNHGYDNFTKQNRIIVMDTQAMNDVLGKSSGRSSRLGIALPSIQNITQIIMTLYHHIKQQSEQAEILVIIDALNDLVIEGTQFMSENERLSRIGSSIMAASQMWGVRFIATAHARKVTNWRKPSMDDVYGSSALKYVAKAIAFVYNDYKTRRHESPLTIEVQPADHVKTFWSVHEGKPRLTAPVLVLNFLKVKTSGLDGNTFLSLNPYTTKVKPEREEEWEYYNTLLASGEL